MSLLIQSIAGWLDVSNHILDALSYLSAYPSGMFDSLEVIVFGVSPSIFLEVGSDGCHLLLNSQTLHLPLLFVNLAHDNIGVILIDFFYSFQQPS